MTSLLSCKYYTACVTSRSCSTVMSSEVLKCCSSPACSDVSYFVSYCMFDLPCEKSPQNAEQILAMCCSANPRYIERLHLFMPHLTLFKVQLSVQCCDIAIRSNSQLIKHSSLFSGSKLQIMML